jgi:hypothetical protein
MPVHAGCQLAMAVNQESKLQSFKTPLPARERQVGQPISLQQRRRSSLGLELEYSGPIVLWVSSRRWKLSMRARRVALAFGSDESMSLDTFTM